MNRTARLFLSCLCVAPVLLSGCQPKVPTEALMLSPQSLEQRQVQVRRFDTSDEAKVLSACAALLQDTGFTIDKSETKLGLITASKQRSAKNAAQITGSIILALLTGAYIPTDATQKMRASIVTYPYGEERKNIAVRVTFQRIVWNDQGGVTRKEGLTDPEIYREFFEKLSKSLFLEANQL